MENRWSLKECVETTINTVCRKKKVVKEETGWWGSSKYGEGQTEAGGEFGEWRWRERE
jgi:hypothetical protein